MDFQSVNNLQTYGGGLLTTTGITTSPISLTQSQSTSGGLLGNDLIGQAGDLLTGGIFSSVLSAITNLSNIGASTNPTQEMNSFLGHIQPILEGKMASINESNVSQVLTDLDEELMFNWNGYKHLSDHHARASSTKEAYKVVMAKCMEFRTALQSYVNGLKNSGAKISQTTKSSDFNLLENKISFADGRKFDSEHKYTVTSNVYTVTIPVIQQIKNAVTGQISDVTEGQQEAGSGGIFGIAIVGVVLAKIFKIF